ncbi:hypothetical protein AJ85_07055 [Alkalihalobacillus alcalophilus ATCC 27647 = CGMCC 1.3604]|uniref:DUF4350 domain-containing protein n=1 Tax=Alkalihalobacillus alcalophilus ATCC 27647 = CGMCC 1.3604 TaxID=1218173 RepID=A0A094YR35_ALKAL|nr:DUF4350 domain-containing protein [Alkalihalobacillus alcalophilus]KGA95932.1 hypothetical protein BALCAV_0219345 [Alkalihalobacillus alcalophilus ATCC 27647 = CGMCC 1.3604]MED1564055.1 DUF4350 domain-containing protein [Alkalihalobacillus alcalophilus]THG91079.1 hypothetical protein AJ85_07055 [Alkalihalobacillus alcalophilus ATCC 27647 = CGMCC 1.3604]
MKSTYSTKRAWLYIVIVIVIFWIIGYFIFSKQPQEYPPYLSESPSPSGTKAIYTYLENTDSEITRWRFTPDLLETNESEQLLVMIEPSFMLSREEMDEYIQFMEAGNSILFISQLPTDYFGIKTDIVSVDEEQEYAEIKSNNELLLEGLVTTPLRLVLSDESELLLEDNYGPLAVETSVGAGSLTVLMTPEWLMNHFILDADHLELFTEVLNESLVDTTSILFDEYIHNVDDQNSYFAFYPFWFQLLFVQLMMLTIFILWIQGKRFGPILKVREETVRFSDESLRALAVWHLKSKQYRHSLNIQADYLKVSIQERFGISYTKPWEDISEPLERQLANKEVKSFIVGLQAVLTKPDLSKQEYLQWSKKIEHLRKEVEEG